MVCNGLKPWGKRGLASFAAAFGLTACAGTLDISGAHLPPPTAMDEMPVYRNLADLPEKPDVGSQQEHQAAVQTLTADRARTAAAASSLRNQNLAAPAPAPPVSGP